MFVLTGYSRVCEKIMYIEANMKCLQQEPQSSITENNFKNVSIILDGFSLA